LLFYIHDFDLLTICRNIIGSRVLAFWPEDHYLYPALVLEVERQGDRYLVEFFHGNRYKDERHVSSPKQWFYRNQFYTPSEPALQFIKVSDTFWNCFRII